jgi:hypothetical protein
VNSNSPSRCSTHHCRGEQQQPKPLLDPSLPRTRPANSDSLSRHSTHRCCEPPTQRTATATGRRSNYRGCDPLSEQCKHLAVTRTIAAENPEQHVHHEAPTRPSNSTGPQREALTSSGTPSAATNVHQRQGHDNILRRWPLWPSRAPHAMRTVPGIRRGPIPPHQTGTNLRATTTTRQARTQSQTLVAILDVEDRAPTNGNMTRQ